MKKIIELLIYKNLETEKRVGHKIAKNYVFLLEFLFVPIAYWMWGLAPDFKGNWILVFPMIVGWMGLFAFISNTVEYFKSKQ